MFKKLISLAIAAMMVVSAGAVAASAAEVEEAPVAAEESAAVSADSSDATGAASKIYFDVESSGWKNYQYISFHIWRADSTGTWTTWGTRAERGTLEDDGRWSYDVTKAGNNKDGSTISASDGRYYCAIVYADTGIQTYNTIMSGACIGDEIYITGSKLENPEDDAKTAIEAAWRNNPDCGPEIKIASSGNIVGSAYPEGESAETLLATYLIAYYDDEAKMSKVQGLFDSLNVYTVDVFDAASKRLEAQVASGTVTTEDAQAKLDAILNTLGSVTGHDKPQDNGDDPAPTLPKEPVKVGDVADQNNADTDSGNTTSNNNSGNTSTNSGSTGSGSSSVSSGQETTIFFVLGGVLLAAAGVMFLSRRRRED